MSNHSTQIVQRLWNYCNILRDDGLSYGDYVEQLTFLLFLKMADVRRQKLDKAQLRYLNAEQLRGVELVDGVARLCAMNLLLHGIGGDDTYVPILVKDALGRSTVNMKWYLRIHHSRRRVASRSSTSRGRRETDIGRSPRRFLGHD